MERIREIIKQEIQQIMNEGSAENCPNKKNSCQILDGLDKMK